MKQADLGLNLAIRRTRKREFLAQIERVVPWSAPNIVIPPAERYSVLAVRPL
jgi:transposase, IS5 family